MTGPAISTAAGRHAGTIEDGIECYLGIRYAEIDHRFAPPTPVSAHQDVRPATDYGPSPLQLPTPYLPQDLQLSEDCLNLNIWTPGARSGALPVLVWIYGGGFEGGSNALPQTRGSVIATKGPMVVVSLNYRVGALGFTYVADRGGAFSHATNLGIQDVIAGLQWINTNIRNFGGDPSRITVMGESAGAFIAGALAAAPAAKGLFHRLAMFSGGASRLVPMEQAKSQASILISALDAATRPETLLECPGEAILAAQRAFISTDIGARNGIAPQALGVVLDAGTPNAVLEKHPMEAFSSGEAADIPILVSSTQDEIYPFRNSDPAGFDPESHEALQAAMEEWGIPGERIASMHWHYSDGGNEDPGTAKERLLTDWIYRLPAARLAQAHSKAGGSAYLALVPRVGQTPAGHACEVNALFGIPCSVETPGEKIRRSSITDSVVAFATRGQPGWAAATGDRLHAFSFGDGAFDATADYTLLLELWDGITRP